jgi:hypothetical protein
VSAQGGHGAGALYALVVPPLLALTVGAPLVASAGRPAAHRVTARDRATTRAYLRADYAYERSLVASAHRDRAAARALAVKLVAECPGALAGAPGRAGSSSFEPPPLAPRKRGEANRERRQRVLLELELIAAVLRAYEEPDRAQALAYARAVGSLRWTDAGLTSFVHTSAAALEAELRSVPLDVCADLRFWTQSGYRTLPHATKMLGRRVRGLVMLLLSTSGPDPVRLLRPVAGPRERALARRIARLQRRGGSSLESLSGTLARTGRALGIPSAPEEREAPPEGAVVIGRGRTASGARYQIWIPLARSAPDARHAPPAGPGPPSGPSCAIPVEYEVTEGDRSGDVSTASGSGVCLSRTHPAGIHLLCQGDHWQIEGQTVEGATSVRLNVRSGGQVVSPVALVPAAQGGPAGFYLQLLKPSQVPASLEELSGEGRVLRRIGFSRKRKCLPPKRPKRPKRPRVRKPPRLLATRVIAEARVPGGPRFRILAYRVRFLGRVRSSIHAEVVSGEPFPLIGTFSGEGSGPRRPRRSPFGLRRETGCQPREYALIYGILRKPGDTVLARTSSGLRALHRVHIPQALHANGDLAYIALDSMPTEVIVRSASGKPVAHQDLRSQARDLRERCEGEAEG